MKDVYIAASEHVITACINRILSWPVAICVLAFYFRTPLHRLLRQLQTLEIPGGFKMNSTASEQGGLATIEEPGQLAAKVTEQSLSVLPADIRVRRETVRTWGGSEPIVLEQMSMIERDLVDLNFHDEEARLVLIRQLAGNQLLNRCFVLYHVIFGSQIAALRLMNEHGKQAPGALERLFETAKTAEPDFYGTYSFGEWLNYLRSQGAMTDEDHPNEYMITVFGRYFLRFLEIGRLTSKAH